MNKLLQRSAIIGLSSLLVLSCTTPSFVQNSQFNRRFSPKIAKFFNYNALSPSIEKPEVIPMPTENHNERPDGTVINTIVLHHTATAADAKRVGKFFQNPKAGVSSHYIVDRTGYIVQPVDDNLRSWHAGRSEFNGVGNVNDFSIGIEICNLGDSAEPYPDAQYDAVIRLVAYLVKTYNVPLPHITRHRDIGIPHGRKIDTSNNFSVKRVVDGVQAMLDGSYKPGPIRPVKNPIKFSPYRLVKIQTAMTFKDLADIYLDAPNRWKEIQYLNQSASTLSKVPAGSSVKIPTDYRHFERLN